MEISKGQTEYVTLQIPENSHWEGCGDRYFYHVIPAYLKLLFLPELLNSRYFLKKLKSSK